MHMALCRMMIFDHRPARLADTTSRFWTVRAGVDAG